MWLAGSVRKSDAAAGTCPRWRCWWTTTRAWRARWRPAAAARWSASRWAKPCWRSGTQQQRRWEQRFYRVIANILLEPRLRGEWNLRSVCCIIAMKWFCTFFLASYMSRVTLDEAAFSLKCLRFILEPSSLIWHHYIIISHNAEQNLCPNVPQTA